MSFSNVAAASFITAPGQIGNKNFLNRRPRNALSNSKSFYC